MTTSTRRKPTPRKQKRSYVRRETTTTDTCVHYWDIDSDDVGRCRKCGQVKDFRKLQNTLAQRRKASNILGGIVGGRI